MSSKQDFTLRKRIKSFAFAWNGIKLVWLQEYNFRIHLFITLAVIVLGFALNILFVEWMMIIFAISIVLICEVINSAIERICDFINPNIIVVPNLYHSSCEPIVKYAYKKKIYVFMHSSEGMFYNNKIQNDKYPKHLIKKLEKILSWGKMDSEYLIKKGYKKKLVETGCLKFDEKNYNNCTCFLFFFVKCASK